MKIDVDAMVNKAKDVVIEHHNATVANPLDMEATGITREDVFITWFSKTLQNWKALVATNKFDGTYYEITYNGDKKETYVDVYKKYENLKIVDS